MKKTALLTLSIVTTAVLLSACGNNTTGTAKTDTTEISTAETETTEVDATETDTTEISTGTTEDDITETETTEMDTTTASSTTVEIAELESWPEYKETMEYYVSNGLISAAAAYSLNPDIYGVDTYGKSSSCLGIVQSSPNLGDYVKEIDLTTTKGYNIMAFWYMETNTVQYIYDGEAMPSCGVFTDLDSADALEEALNDSNSYNHTHQQKIDILGEPSMTDEETIAAIKEYYKEKYNEDL
jgi:hypothetical protein